MDRTGPFIRVVREVETFRRFFVNTYDGDIRGRLFFPSQFEQQTQAHVFIKAMAKGKDTDDEPDDAREKT
jgi:hypothetical protein